MRQLSRVFVVWFLVVQEEELYACQRGCRLFSICQFVRDSEDLNQTRFECESSKSLTEVLTYLRRGYTSACVWHVKQPLYCKQKKKKNVSLVSFLVIKCLDVSK